MAHDLYIPKWFDEDLDDDTGAPPASITSLGGLHHIMQGMGDVGVAVVPQTLHTIEVGIAV